LHQRLPKKRGFTNIFRQEYATVNLGSFAIFTEEAEVTPQTMMTAGLVKSLKQPIKVLGEGELERPLVIKANKFSRGAKDKIMSAGGRVVEIGEFEKGAAEI
jgi:large subunit ribosomal protein L15